MRALITAAFLLATPVLGTAAGAECVGQNLLDTMPASERAVLTAAADAVPYPNGNFWTATKGDATLTLVGTYHLNDPRHAQTMAAIAPLIDAATTVLVEAGPEEEAALTDRMGRDPSILLLKDSTLLEHMPADDWALVASAMTNRGIPPFMAAKFQPWYVAVMLSIAPCQMIDMLGEGGLDKLIINHATAASIPVRALEPYDKMFRIFDTIPLEQQISMIRSTVALEPRAADYAITLADAYFAGTTRLIWEVARSEAMKMPGTTPQQVNAEFALMEEALSSTRNRGWIPVLEGAAADGPVLAAFGALHLPGNDGVLALLDRAGWTLTPLSPVTP